MRNYNAKKSIQDERDFIYEDFIKFNYNELPIVVDYRNELQPIRNQGDQGSCYAQSAACMKEWQEYQDYKLDEYLSPQFFYNNRNYMNDDNLENDGDNGMTGRDVMRILKDVGICKELEYKYDNLNRLDNCSDIPEWIKINALKHRIKSYARVNSLNGLKANLFYNGPCLIAFPVYGNGRKINDIMWLKENEDDKFMGGHAMTVVGYDDIKKHFVIRNSWGRSWGDEGYCYYKYENWDTHWECWTTIDLETIIDSETDNEDIIHSDDAESNEVVIHSDDTESNTDISEENYYNDIIQEGIYEVYLSGKKVENIFLISHRINFTIESSLYEWKNNKYINYNGNNDEITTLKIDNFGYSIITNNNTSITIFPYYDNDSDDDKKSKKCPCTIM